MNTADNITIRKKKIGVLVLFFIALLIAILSLLPSIQNKFKPYFFQNSRLILAKINAHFGMEQTEYLILKIKDALGVQIEIYEIDASKNPIYKQKFELTQDTDAHITLDKNTTNLALSDIDKDGQLDIIAPSADRNGNLRLNTFRYNPELRNFEPILQP